MDWVSLANVATSVGVLVALLGVIASTSLTYRQEKLTREGQLLEREQADAAAARSEAAAALTEEYTRRVVDALETMARNQSPQTLTAVPANVRWRLVPHAGDTYLLTNVGSATAHSVEVTGHETLILRAPAVQDVAADEGVTFLAARSLATSDSTVTVRWHDNDDIERTWRYPLPAGPSKPR